MILFQLLHLHVPHCSEKGPWRKQDNLCDRHVRGRCAAGLLFLSFPCTAPSPNFCTDLNVFLRVLFNATPALTFFDVIFIGSWRHFPWSQLHVYKVTSLLWGRDHHYFPANPPPIPPASSHFIPSPCLSQGLNRITVCLHTMTTIGMTLRTW